MVPSPATLAALVAVMLLAGGVFQTASATTHAPTLSVVDWAMINADSVRFHMRWTNPDTSASQATSGAMISQFLGAFAYDYLTIGTFSLSALPPGGHADLYFAESVGRLPPPPAKVVPYGGPPAGWSCPTDTVWSGSVHVRWDSLGTTADATRHEGHLMVDPGAGASLIHVVSHCAGPASWTITDACAGFQVALLGEDKTTPAPDSLPVNWTGYVSVSSPAGTGTGLTCLPRVAVTCGGAADTIRVRATTCVWPGPHSVTLETVEWAMLAADTVRFHVRLGNADTQTASEATSGYVASQELGAFMGDYLTIGTFDLPALAPGEYRDLYYDKALSGLPPAPAKLLPYGGPPAGWACPPDTAWSGSVHVRWDSLGTTVGAARHAGQLTVDPGAGPSLIRVLTTAEGTAQWTIAGLCADFAATLLESDQATPAPNPLPAGWSGYVAVTASAGTAGGVACQPEVALSCNGRPDTIRVLATTCAWPRPHAPTLEAVDWATLNADSVRFHLRWANHDTETASQPTSGTLLSQFLGAFAYDYLPIGTFDLPALAPGAVRDLYYDEAVSVLPPAPAKSLPYGGPPAGWPCPADAAWSGSVHVRWDSLGATANATRHEGHLMVDPGAGASLIRVVSHCTSPATWTITGACAGFDVALLGEDKVTPAPSLLPVDWTGYVSVSSPDGTASGLTCRPEVTVIWGGAADTIRVYATTCAWPKQHAPTLAAVDWATLGPDSVRFRLRWTNPDLEAASQPASGSVASQEFGAFAGDYLNIGSFDLPALAPGAFEDLYFDKALSGLPPAPAKTLPYGGPPAGWACQPDTAWTGSVHVRWDSLGVQAQVVRHAGQLLVDPGAGPSFVRVLTGCDGAATWTVAGLCAGFAATLVDNDQVTPASNPLPAGWSGYVAVTAAAGTGSGQTCGPEVALSCSGLADTIHVLAVACAWPGLHAPTLETVEWAKLTADSVRFHVRWANPNAETASQPASGALISQYLGAFAYDYLTIGTFDLPALAPGAVRDFYFDEAVNRLPPAPPRSEPYGGPPEAWSCPPDTAWTGSVHVRWDSLGTTANATRHVGHLRVDPGADASLIHVVTHCAGPATWTITGACAGFDVTLLGEDKVTPAPDTLSVDWTGYVSVSSPSHTDGGLSCRPEVAVTCGGAADTIQIYATTCFWASAGVQDETPRVDFGIRTVAPNPTPGPTRISFGLPRSAQVHMSIIDVSGKRVRTLIAGELPAGLQSVVWDGRGESGGPLPAGVYFLSLRAEGRATSRSMILLR